MFSRITSQVKFLALTSLSQDLLLIEPKIRHNSPKLCSEGSWVTQGESVFNTQSQNSSNAMLPLQVEQGPRKGRKRKNYGVWEIGGGRKAAGGDSDVVLPDSHLTGTDGGVAEK